MPETNNPKTDAAVEAILNASASEVADDDRRDGERHPYEADAAIVLHANELIQVGPILVRTADISTRGISVYSRQMLRPGCRGLIQLRRSDGRRTILGVEVRYCHYVSQLRHCSGLQLLPLDGKVDPSIFNDESGRPMLPPL